jgi:hypothetical protein
MAETFEQFLEEWRKKALPTVTGKELNSVLEARGRELSELAVSRGFRSQLTNACKPYRTMREFVRALYDASDHHQRKTNGKDGS